MNKVLVTTESDSLGGVLAASYREAGGRPFDHVLILPTREDLAFSAWQQGYVALKLFGLRGTLRLIRIRHFPALLSRKETQLGLASQWPASMAADAKAIRRIESLNSREAREFLRGVATDMLVSVGAPQVFRKKVLEIPRIGSINVHNGRIPKYRGHFSSFWEVVNNEERGFSCVHEMAPQVDAGAVLAFSAIPLATADSFLDVLIEKKRMGGRLLAQVLLETSRRGELPKPAKGLPQDRVSLNCFPWPKISDIRRFSWRNRQVGNP